MSILFPTKRLVTDRRYYESGVRGRFEGNLRVERGSIDTTGPTKISGEGFTIVKNGTGDVTVTFDPPFSAVPSTTSIAISDGLTVKGSYNRSRGTSFVRIVRYDVALRGAEDGEIDFVVIGPS